MPSIRIEVTNQQKQALKQFADSKRIKNVSEYVRGLIRADMQAHGKSFSPDVKWGTNRYTQEQAERSHNKQILFGDLLQRLSEAIPVAVADMTTSTGGHLQALIEDFEERDVIPDLLKVVKEAKTILDNEGYIALMRWFGIVPLVDEETRTTIGMFRIMSADED